MQKEENLQWESAQKGNTTNKSVKKSKQGPKTKSKIKNSKAAKDQGKRIKDYFPTVPKAVTGRQEDSGVGPKDETRITDHTTPDKSRFENGNWQTTEDNTGKQEHLKCLSSTSN